MEHRECVVVAAAVVVVVLAVDRPTIELIDLPADQPTDCSASHLRWSGGR